MMPHGPHFLSPANISRACRLNWPLNPFWNFPMPPSSLVLSLSGLFPPPSPLKCNSPTLSHRGTSERRAAKWPALCFILLVVRFCFFVFYGLTFIHKVQEDSDSPGTDTHTCKRTRLHTHVHLHQAEEFRSETSGIFSSFCQSHDVIIRRHNASSPSPIHTVSLTHSPLTQNRQTHKLHGQTHQDWQRARHRWTVMWKRQKRAQVHWPFGFTISYFLSVNLC